MSAKKSFENWRKEYPNASRASAEKVWAMYNGDKSPEELESSFKELNFRETPVAKAEASAPALTGNTSKG